MTLTWTMCRRSPRSITTPLALAVIAMWSAGATGDGDEPVKAAKPTKKKKEVIAGKADVLRAVPKKFATLINSTPQSCQVVLKIEGEDHPTTWQVQPDAEIKVDGWWGRLEHLTQGERVWVWWSTDRRKKPKQILMIADEFSEQDIHNLPYSLQAVDAERRVVTIERSDVGQRSVALARTLVATTDGEEVEIKSSDGHVFQGALGEKIFVQTAGNVIQNIRSQDDFHDRQSRQKESMRKIWREKGLPGVVTFLHPLAGEMEIMLDHESMRWARYLKPGDRVTLNTSDPIKSLVKGTTAWRERTNVRLVSDTGHDQADLTIGQRVTVLVPEPPKSVQSTGLPTDIDRRRSRSERIEWVLANTYCTCSIGKDRCTGMFYTLASCNVNGCGMPNRIRSMVEPMIDKGMTDEQVLSELRKSRGADLLKPHLLK